MDQKKGQSFGQNGQYLTKKSILEAKGLSLKPKKSSVVSASVVAKWELVDHGPIPGLGLRLNLINLNLFVYERLFLIVFLFSINLNLNDQ